LLYFIEIKKRINHSNGQNTTNNLLGNFMSDREILFSTNNIVFYIDETVPCLINEWRGFIKSSDFRSGILKLLAVYKEQQPHYQTLYLLADTRTLGVISREDLAWVTEEINPQYVALGTHYEAFVVSKDAFGQISLNRYMVSTTKKGNFTVQIFDTMEDAKAWLRSLTI